MARVARRFGAWLSAAAVGALVLYPVLVYVGLDRWGPRFVAFFLIGVCVVRLCVARFGAASPLGPGQLLAMSAGGIVLAVVSLVIESPNAMLYYPVLMNAVLFALFAASLAYPPTVVERIARLRDPNLPAEAIPYLRRVTLAWCVFFVCNGAAALYTVLWTPLATWAFYNGLLAYVLIGAMFAGELLTRMLVMRNLRK